MVEEVRQVVLASNRGCQRLWLCCFWPPAGPFVVPAAIYYCLSCPPVTVAAASVMYVAFSRHMLVVPSTTRAPYGTDSTCFVIC